MPGPTEWPTRALCGEPVDGRSRRRPRGRNRRTPARRAGPAQTDDRARRPLRFRNVPASPVNAIRLEVAIYEFRDIDVPTRVDRVYSQASNLQLPEGTWVSFAGAGLNGRRLDPTILPEAMPASISSAMACPPLDSRCRRPGRGRPSIRQLGAAASLGPIGAWAAILLAIRPVPAPGRCLAMAAVTTGSGTPMRNISTPDSAKARTCRRRPAGATETATPRSAGPSAVTARLSLIHGSLTDPVNGTIEYTKPAADWRPIESLSLSARPDYRGEYSYAAGWYPGTRSNFR